MRRHLCRSFLFLLAAATVATPAAAAADRPPNIVHVVADDVGYDDLSCFGATKIKTPHLDKLAREGMRFTSFYAPSSTCTPTRAALMTGCYPERVGVNRVLFPTDRTGLADAEVTIAELLKARGYATACVGKWHLGHQPKFLPTRHGFDLYFGIPYPNDHGPERKAHPGLPPIPLIRGEQVVEQPAVLDTLPDRFTAEAVKFITDNRDRPFFLHLSNIETHTPWFVPERFKGKSADGPFGDAVECLDWSVGEVMRTLAELKLDGNTLVVFTSDNGPLVHAYPELEGIYGAFARVNPARPHVLREGKYQTRYEGGTRVSAIARWPGKVPAGRTCDEVVAGFDLYPTFAAAAGAALPADRIIDGKDLTPLLTGAEGAKSPHEAFFYYQNFRLWGVRSGKWKLVFPGPGPGGGGRPGTRPATRPGAAANRPGGRPATQPAPVLYDLEADLGETTNVAAANPEVVKRLSDLADRMRDDLGDAARNNPGTNRRPAGTMP